MTFTPSHTDVSPWSGNDEILECLHTIPEEASDVREFGDGFNLVSGVPDDVNALSLNSKQPSSYLGVSSIYAVLKVIVSLDSACLSNFLRASPGPGDDLEQAVFRSSNPTPWPSQAISQAMPDARLLPLQASRQSTEVHLIEAYFTYFQPVVPMLDEQGFWEIHKSGSRKDNRWLGLLNIVLALGSIAGTTADDSSHYTYYLRARNHLSLDALGSAHLETIQALGLMGGYYLHYVSQPNLAYSLMGAALRMAMAMGLHEEPTRSDNSLSELSLDRRVWWSLFCMDTWGSATLGRPSMGRYKPTIAVKIPQWLKSVRTCPRRVNDETS